MTIISFVSRWKLLHNSASSRITLVHSRVSTVSLLSSSFILGLDTGDFLGLDAGDLLLGLLLLPSRMDAIEKSDFISLPLFLICWSVKIRFDFHFFVNLRVADSPCTRRQVSASSNCKWSFSRLFVKVIMPKIEVWVVFTDALVNCLCFLKRLSYKAVTLAVHYCCIMTSFAIPTFTLPKLISNRSYPLQTSQSERLLGYQPRPLKTLPVPRLFL